MTIDPTRMEMETDPLTARFRGIAVHGDTPFDVPWVSHIIGNIWQGGCETGLVLPKTIEHLVSLYPWEEYTQTHDLKSMLYVTMYDSVDQAFHQIDSIAAWVASCASDGPTLVHCQGGLNRSSLVVAKVIMDQGHSAEFAIDLIRMQRSPACLCNPAFEKWLREQ